MTLHTSVKSTALEPRAGTALSRRVLTVYGKGGKERTVPLEPEVESILVEYLESRLRRFPGRLAANAALFAVAMLAGSNPELQQKLQAFRAAQTETARAMVVPPEV